MFVLFFGGSNFIVVSCQFTADLANCLYHFTKLFVKGKIIDVNIDTPLRCLYLAHALLGLTYFGIFGFYTHFYIIEHIDTPLRCKQKKKDGYETLPGQTQQPDTESSHVVNIDTSA